MYVTYETRQHIAYEDGRFIRYRDGPRTHCRQPPKKFSTLPKPDFMPSRLVRTSDMEVVRGSTVNEGYCALSYSWNQSGDYYFDATAGKAKLVDRGRHKIKFPTKRVRRKIRGRRRIPAKTKFVKFEGIIQQICKDFGVKYIWYDQMCINQDNKKEKQDEIRQMHLVYRNAHCTLALIPELEVVHDLMAPGYLRTLAAPTHKIATSHWNKRLWTLEEAVMSSNLLFIGKNVHVWWHAMDKQDSVRTICQPREVLNASIILRYAHLRTSSNIHDRVFALANIFPEIMDGIAIDYDQPIQDLIIQFYSTLAKKDLSILCFAGYTSYYTGLLDYSAPSSQEPAAIPIREFDLPSWTGVEGEHTQAFLETTFQNYSIVGRNMHVKCAGISRSNQWPIYQDSFALTDADIPPFPPVNPDTTKRMVLRLMVYCHLPGQEDAKRVQVCICPRSSTKFSIRKLKDVSFAIKTLSHFMLVKKETLFWIEDEHIGRFDKDNNDWLDIWCSLTEHLDCSLRYTMLVIPFKEDRTSHIAHLPIIKKVGDYYKAIGYCTVTNIQYLFSGYTLPQEQTYIIQ